MSGLNKTTGLALYGTAHLQQSIQDILSTPIGSRVMRRDYGSRLFSLIDTPVNRQTIILFYSAVADALRKWEPRFRLEKVRLADSSDGNVNFDLYGVSLINGEALKMEGLIIQ